MIKYPAQHQDRRSRHVGPKRAREVDLRSIGQCDDVGCRLRLDRDERRRQFGQKCAALGEERGARLFKQISRDFGPDQREDRLSAPRTVRARRRQVREQIVPGTHILAGLEREPRGDLDTAGDARRHGSGQVEPSQAGRVFGKVIPDRPVAQHVVIEIESVGPDLAERLSTE